MRIRNQRHAQAGGGYRPARAWLGSPGDGVPIRARRSGGRWGFRWVQLRIPVTEGNKYRIGNFNKAPY